MSLRLGDIAPDFRANTTEGAITFHEWLGEGWGVLFSHPADFTPVCTTELGELSRLRKEFEKRNTKIIALSIDPMESHHNWIKDINETQKTKVNYPLIADPDFTIANLYGMIHPNVTDRFTARSVYVIGPDKKIKLMITYPAATGRNFVELLRVIDSLQLTAYHKVATPVNWKQGEDCVILTSVTNEEAKKLFPAGFNEIKPYLRTTPQPGTT